MHSSTTFSEHLINLGWAISILFLIFGDSTFHSPLSSSFLTISAVILGLLSINEILSIVKGELKIKWHNKKE